jgi:SNF2 family DNA or RNA helicase
MEQRPLWSHQNEAIEMANKLPQLYIAFEMGTGKTRTIIEILRRRYTVAGRLMRTLIYCPAIVVSNWKAEFQMYSRIKPHDLVLLQGPGKRRVKSFVDSCTYGGQMVNNKIIVTNYEALQMEDLQKAIAEWQPEILVCDEAHVLKSHKSKRAKALLPVSNQARFKYLLSGTPILNSIEDIWMQFKVLDGGQTFGENYFSFRARYMEDKNAAFAGKEHYFPKFEPRADMYMDLQNNMYRKTIRAMKKDCLDLPPLIKQTVEVEMSPEQARMYKEMKQNYITWVESAKNSGDPLPVVAQLAITKALRLQQIVSGYAMADNGVVKWIEKNPRLDALEELLEGLVKEHKVIVWCVFKENYKMIARRLEKMGVKFTTLTGEQNHKEKDEAMDSFRKDSSVRVMIANQAAGGVGVNLVEADYAVYFSKNFSLKDDLQSEARNYRGGSNIHEKVTRIDIVCRDTIDDVIAEALASKQDISNKVLDRSFWEKI